METVTDPSPDETRSSTTIRTTLYDLIEAISAEVEPEEEHLVVATVVHLFQSGQITFLRDPEHNN
jgi:hypothetical protein